MTEYEKKIAQQQRLKFLVLIKQAGYTRNSLADELGISHGRMQAVLSPSEVAKKGMPKWAIGIMIGCRMGDEKIASLKLHIASL